MTHAQQWLRQLISQDMYVVDERAIATAIIARANVHATVAGASFRSELRRPIRKRGASQPHRRPRAS